MAMTRSLQALLILALVVPAFGCSSKKVKGCIDRCARETETCGRKRESGCPERGKTCEVNCETSGGQFSF
jgi:hypothetical protein